MMNGDLITIKNDKSSAIINLFGATLTSWKPNGKEVIFVSKNSKFDNQKPIRGGIPVIFPQFGPWKLGPQHGFARRTKWILKEHTAEKKESSATFILEDSNSSREIWNCKFLFEYSITLISDTELKMDAVITNTGDKSFDFTFLLHTYFSVPNILTCEIDGLKGCLYVDKVKDGSLLEEKNECVMLSEFTDRVYQNTPATHLIKNVAGDRNLEIQKINLPDTVVWNPWTENAKKMDDFGDDEWKNMICVEAGYVSNSYSLEPSGTYKASQILRICD